MAPPIRIRITTPASRGTSRGPGIRDLGPRVLSGCCIEAERADQVWFCLQGLRNALPEHLHPHLNAVIDHLHHTSKLLRDLADRSQVHLSQVPVMVDYLNVILPCLCRTLRDIMEYYEDRTRDREHRWRAMYHNMSNELPGTTLPARFLMYNQFLELLNFMLMRDPNFDVNAMEALRARILLLRDARQIAPPSPIGTDLVRRESALEFWHRETDSHWAEAIFTQPLPSRREFKKRSHSHAYGPLERMGLVEPIRGDFKILIKRTFDNDRICVVVFLRQDDQEPYILIRMRASSIENWIDIRLVQNLYIKRESPSVILLSYVDHPDGHFSPWAKLSFLTWEELVLFYCTFVSLKVRTDAHIEPRELTIRREKHLFRARIIDNAFDHFLIVTEDKDTKGHRLHAVADQGPLKRCPIWTAFIPPDYHESWLIHKSPHRIWLRNIQVYSFSEDYHPHKQHKGKAGAFEIVFAKSKAATEFKQLFSPIPAPSVDEASEDHEDDDLTPHGD